MSEANDDVPLPSSRAKQVPKQSVVGTATAGMSLWTADDDDDDDVVE
jgi:hypothetical protein